MKCPVIRPFSAAQARALLAAIVGLLTICALLQPLVDVPGAQAAPPTSRRFGAVEAYRASELARDARIGWERIIFSWRSYQPDGPDQWNENHIPPYWLWRAESEGREVVGVLISTPGWATTGGGRAVDVPAGLDLPVTDGRNYWAQYVRHLVTQYKGRVNTWVVWNEPDITDPSHPGYQFAGSVSDYYKLVRTAYVVAKSVDPNIKINLGGTTYWWDASHGHELFLKRFLDVAQADPSAPSNNWYFDAVPVQLYGDPMSLYEVPLKLRAILTDKGLNKDIWVSETNVVPWDDPVSPLPRDNYRASQDEQASYVIQAAAAAFAAGVERIGYYKMRDDPYSPGGEPYGMVRVDDSTRPAYSALKVASTYLDGVKRATLTRGGPVTRVDAERAGDTVTIVWNTSGNPIKAKIAARAPEALLVDKAGRETRVTAGPDGYAIDLPAATHNTAPGDPGRFITGGSPFLLIQGGALPASTLALASPSSGTGAADGSGCDYQLGFKALHDAIPDRVGNCLVNEHHNPTNGDGLQETTAWHGKGGLLAWRKSDNWTAFTDGSTTWVNGPYGVQKRPNAERFSWEKD